MSWSCPETVLGNRIHWNISQIPGTKKGTWSGKDDQLWRCRKTKRFEASLLIYLPYGSTFVDGGAHFGDTVITMALYARDTLKRTDIRFVAIEPCAPKAQFIRNCAAANGFDEQTIRVIQCVLGDETAMKAAVMRKTKYDCKYDGRISYEWADSMDNSNKEEEDASTSSVDEVYDVRRLDDFFDVIHPLGFLHLDVEGWEAAALDGASALLLETNSSGQCYVLAECLSFQEAKSRGPGFSLVQEYDIMSVMSKHPKFNRGEDVIDEERNLFFIRDG